MKRTAGLLLTLLLLAGCSKSAPTTAPTPPVAVVTPEPTTPPEPQVPAPIDGPIYLLTQPEKPLWPGPAVSVVENSPMARPQSGLDKADLVVEALSESEITRNIGIFWSQPTDKIGPVRSARTFFIAIAEAYGSPFAHAGGSMEALAILRESWGARNLDEIYGSGEYFTRTSDRRPPHNLYTSTEQLNQAITNRKIELKAVPTTPRGATPAPADPVRKVAVTWHSLHEVTWEWDGQQYKRLEDGGTPHTLDSGNQIAVPNLIFLQTEGVNKGPDLGWTLAMDQGGKASVVSGGHTWEGSWTLIEGGFALQPSAGKVPALQPGGVWVHLITNESNVELSK